MSTRDTDQDWDRISESDPYWGVLSVDKYKGKELSEEERNSFFKSGEVLIANIMGFVRQHLAPDFTPKTALDFGCGVGRLVIPLARMAKEQVVGIDVAQRMLDICKQNCKQAGLTNVKLVRSDDDLSLVDGTFDFVNSYIVIQHIDLSRGYGIVSRLIDLAAVGGIVSIQLTYAKERRFLPHEAGRALYYRRDGDAIVDVLSVGKGPPAGSITMFDYDLNTLFAIVSRVAGHPVMALPTNDDGHLGLHLIFKKVRA